MAMEMMKWEMMEMKEEMMAVVALWLALSLLKGLAFKDEKYEMTMIRTIESRR